MSGAAGAPYDPRMRFRRAAGLLLHPTSLPGPNGIGELGPEALKFVDVLAAAGMRIWQVLPLGPTGYGDSPYQCFSAFAGNPLLVHVGDVGPVGSPTRVDFGEVIPRKLEALRAATTAFVPDAAYHAWCAQAAWWLDDFALFMSAKAAHDGRAWHTWDGPLARREAGALASWRERLSDDIEHHKRVQYLFFSQFAALRDACTARGIQLMGDVPIYVAHDSADVWANPTLFKLDALGTPEVQAGVPPDYFSATGQLWGNPIYAWDRMHANGYGWWTQRMRAALEMFDLVRLDHFRGFAAYWEVPGSDTTAIHGRWVPGPGAALFDAMTRTLGPLPIVAENLGVITPEVEALRERFGYPGMAILQFAFGADGQANDFQPHNYPRDVVVYTGTHDNDTTAGWWASTGAGDSTRDPTMVAKEKAFALEYLGADGTDMPWTLIRTVLASVADTVLIPLQDVLGLGSEARMNLPGRESGNWGFRFAWEQLTPDHLARLKRMASLYERTTGAT